MSGRADRFMERATKLWSEYFAFRVEGVSNDDSDEAPLSPLHESTGGSPSSSPSSSDSESSTTSLSGGRTRKSSSSKSKQPAQASCLSLSVYSAVVVALILTFLVIGRGYIKYLLLSLENTSLWISFLVFAALFTVVSFPMTWGYIVLNIAAGYLYGLLYGVLIVMFCALCGIVIAHVTIRRCLSNFVMTRLANDSVKAIIRVVDSEHGFKMVALSRLTPIPFGLQNALFAVSNIPLHRYIMASMLGMLPSQGMHAYIGSTLRSMEEVISDSGSSITAYAVFIGQLLMAILLLVFVIRRARVEFNKAVQDAEHDHFEDSSSVEKQDLVEKGEVTAHKRVPSNGSSMPPVHANMSPRLNVKLSREINSNNAEIR